MILRSALSLCFVFAAPALVGGCSVVANMSSPQGFSTVHNASDAEAVDGGDENVPQEIPTDGTLAADAAAATPYQGSPLCNASRSTTCYPDDPTTAQFCKLAPDGGPYGATSGYDNAVLACHVQSAADGKAQAVCTAAGAGTSASACLGPTDCASGFECIGSGTCQHYCCMGEDACETNQFCDIQSTSTTAQAKVPVCMPIRPPLGCQLLGATSCSVGQTCAVVRVNGATSCVAIGTASVGDTCDEVHCGRDMVCLGSPGQRRCSQLCRTASPAEHCSASQTCKSTLPLFQNPEFGVCE